MYKDDKRFSYVITKGTLLLIKKKNVSHSQMVGGRY